MSFDESRTCFNCFFRLIEGTEDICRFNAPMPILQGKVTPDIRQDNRTLFAPCPGPACGQWQPENEPEIEEVLPTLIEKE